MILDLLAANDSRETLVFHLPFYLKAVLLTYDKQAFCYDFNVSRETADRLEIYRDLLVKWQKVQNLVAPNTLEHVWSRHFADSAQLLPHLGSEPGTSHNLVDMGAGGGFPGLVLAILMMDQPLWTVHLVEANGRKCAFLRDVARSTGANVEIHNCRIEEFANESTIPSIDVVTARALKPLHLLLDLGSFAFSCGAMGLFLKGKTFDHELEEARRSWEFEALDFASQTDVDGRIVKIFNVQPKA